MHGCFVCIVVTFSFVQIMRPEPVIVKKQHASSGSCWYHNLSVIVLLLLLNGLWPDAKYFIMIHDLHFQCHLEICWGLPCVSITTFPYLLFMQMLFVNQFLNLSCRLTASCFTGELTVLWVWVYSRGHPFCRSCLVDSTIFHEWSVDCGCLAIFPR
jgi:hypothetical protein